MGAPPWLSRTSSYYYHNSQHDPGDDPDLRVRFRQDSFRNSREVRFQRYKGLAYYGMIISLCTCWPRIPGFLLANDRWRLLRESAVYSYTGATLGLLQCMHSAGIQKRVHHSALALTTLDFGLGLPTLESSQSQCCSWSWSSCRRWSHQFWFWQLYLEIEHLPVVRSQS